MTQPDLFEKKSIPHDLPDNEYHVVREIKNRLIENREYRNEIKFCPVCNGRIEDRNVAIYQELISDLYRIYCWLGKNRRHEFNIKDIREKLSKNNYARFGDLVRFGGIVYKFKDPEGKHLKGRYGIHMKRAREFFAGKREIPVQITLNQITNEIIDSKYVTVKDIPSLKTYIDQNGLYDFEKISM